MRVAGIQMRSLLAPHQQGNNGLQVKEVWLLVLLLYKPAIKGNLYQSTNFVEMW